MQLIDSFERRWVALLGQPDRFCFRQLARLISSRSGHYPGRDASVVPMRPSLQKLYLPYRPRTLEATGRLLLVSHGWRP